MYRSHKQWLKWTLLWRLSGDFQFLHSCLCWAQSCSRPMAWAFFSPCMLLLPACCWGPVWSVHVRAVPSLHRPWHHWVLGPVVLREQFTLLCELWWCGIGGSLSDAALSCNSFHQSQVGVLKTPGWLRGFPVKSKFTCGDDPTQTIKAMISAIPWMFLHSSKSKCLKNPGWLAKIFSKQIHVSHRMNPLDDPLTFQLAPSSGQNFNFSNTLENTSYY